MGWWPKNRGKSRFKTYSILIVFAKLRQSLHGFPDFLTLFSLLKYLFKTLLIKLFLTNFCINITIIWRLFRFIFISNKFFWWIHKLFFNEELVYRLIKLIIFSIYLRITTARINLYFFNNIHYTSLHLFRIRLWTKNWRLFYCVQTSWFI